MSAASATTLSAVRPNRLLSQPAVGVQTKLLLTIAKQPMRRCRRRSLEVKAGSQRADDSWSPAPFEMSVQTALKLLGVSDGATFEEILSAKNSILATCKDDQQAITQVEAAYDMLLMRSLNQRQSGKVVNSDIRYADVKPSAGVGMRGSMPQWLQRTIKTSPLSLETPSTADLGLQAGVYGAFMVLTYANGVSSSSSLPYTGPDVPGLILASSFGASLYFMTKKKIKLGKATVITMGGLVAGAVVGSAVENWLQVDIVPLFGIHTPATVISEFILLSQFLVSLYLDNLRVAGFAFVTWSNAWRALDALGIAHHLRKLHLQLHQLVVGSPVSGKFNPASGISLMKPQGKEQEREVRCLQRKLLLESLAKELPTGTIRFSSKVVAIQDSGSFKLLHLVDGTILKTKVLIGCDGVNSVVASYLAFHKPAFTGRMAVRGYAHFQEPHGFGHKFYQLAGNGFRSGFIPCDDQTVYWFFTFTPSSQDKDMEENPSKMKQYVLSKLAEYHFPDELKNVVERSEVKCFLVAPLRYRRPWELVWKPVSQGNVCLAGDAFHPMTPDLGQGGCSALEDGVVLARCLSKALKSNGEIMDDKDMYGRIEMCLKDYSKERKWRCIDLITTSYMIGVIQQSNGWVVSFLRDKILSGFLAWLLVKKTDFDCGKLGPP
ncbi:hypothetical protein ACFE04_016116 [Oxalis oulophora]